MKKYLWAILLAAMTGNAMAQAGGAAQGAPTGGSALSQGQKLTTIVAAAVVAGLIAGSTNASTTSNH